MGNCFFELPQNKSQELLKQDQNRLDAEINKLRSDIKVKMAKLKDIEGDEKGLSKLKNFNLKAMNQEEMAALHQVIGPK